MITIATEDDLDKAIGLANGFAGQEVEEAGFIDWWKKLVRMGMATVFKRESGGKMREAIGVLMFTNPQTGKKWASISFWYIDTSERTLASGVLFYWAQKFLQETGVEKLHFAALLNDRFSVVQNFLVRNGFRPKEVNFIKDL